MGAKFSSNSTISRKNCFLAKQIVNLGVYSMNFSGQLSIEQQFKLKVLQEQVQSLDKEQAQEYLLEMFRQMMVKDNLVKQLLRDA